MGDAIVNKIIENIQLISRTNILIVSCEIALRRMSQDLTDN